MNYFHKALWLLTRSSPISLSSFLYSFACHNVIELQEAWVGRDLKARPAPTRHHEQGCLPPAQAAQGLILPGLEHLQGWDIRSFSGQLCLCLTTLLVKNYLLTSNQNLPSSGFKLCLQGLLMSFAYGPLDLFMYLFFFFFYWNRVL